MSKDENPAPSQHVAPLTPLETELLTALKRFRDLIIGEVHDKWDEGMRAGKLIVALANPTLPYRRDITEIHEAIAKAEARAAIATTEGKSPRIKCAICEAPHDNDVLTDICTSCEARINEEGSP